MNDEAWIQVLEWFREFGPHGRNLGSPTYTRPVKSGTSTTTISPCASPASISRAGCASTTRVLRERRMEGFPYPVFENAVQDVACAYYGHYMMVNARPPREAVLGVEVHRLHARPSLGVPGRLSTSSSPATTCLNDPRFMELPYMDVFMNDMERGHIVFMHENGYQFERFIKEAVESVMLENMDSREALDILRERSRRYWTTSIDRTSAPEEPGLGLGLLH